MVILTLHKEETNMATQCFLTTEELSSRLHYNERYIRQYLLDSVLLEGVHYFRPFGRRKILFIWDAIERDMMHASVQQSPLIPLASGGVCHG
jgi:hypothetical protein